MPWPNWKSVISLILMKTLGGLLALVFVAVALLLLIYPVVCLSTTRGGQSSKVTGYTDHVGKIKTACRLGGIFDVSVAIGKQKFDHVYCFYPVWPDQLQPVKGDIVQVWPAKKPLVGGPPTDGWGWFIVGTIFVLGLVMVEFAFLALTIS